MSPLVLPRSFLASDASMAERVVFILCIVFGSLLSILLTALAIYCIRRRLRRRREAGDDPHRTSSFFGGAPSVADLAPPQPTRRASTRTVPRIAIPSPELGSVFRFDLAHRGSYPTSRPPSGPGLTPKKGHSPQYDSLFSRTSTMVASPMPEKGTQLRVINPSPLSPKIGSELQKPVPAYRAGFNSSRERLVSSAASADSLFTGTTSTPPLSPPDTWSNLGTNTIDSPVDVASSGGSVLVRKSLSQQSYTTLASPPPHISVECFEMASLEDPEHTPRAHGASPLSLSAPQDRWDPPPVGGATGTPVTLSHFPFRFSAGAPHSPGLPSIAQNAPVPGPQGNTRSPRLSDSQLSVPGARVKVHGLGLNRQGSRQSLPSQSAPALKLKIKHHVSDEIIAIAFAPRTINFGAVSDGVRGRLGFEPRRVWTDAGTDITDDASLWKWLEEQYTQGHTRLMLHVE